MAPHAIGSNPPSHRSKACLRLYGVRVEAHWSCVLLLAYILWRASVAGFWGAATGVSMVLIVLVHELGHALACRWVGGRVDKVVLWPFGGLAHATPPNRAGGVFWTVFGGPLANILLAAPLYAAAYVTHRFAWAGGPAANQSARDAFVINFLILAFNLLPVYPLDGARLVQAILWKFCGRWQASEVSGLVGLACAGAGAVAGAIAMNPWLTGIGLVGAAFSVREGRRARTMAASLRHTRNTHRCPGCGAAPAIGSFWQCSCGHAFDAVAHAAQCPACGRRHETTMCLDCGSQHPLSQWSSATAAR